MGAVFLDSAICIHAVDPRDDSRDRRDTARAIMLERRYVLSTQVMVETYATLCELDLMAPRLAHAYLGRLSVHALAGLEADDVLRALDHCERFGIDQGDGLILRAAEKARADILYTDRFEHGRTYATIRACNPFIEDFLASN